MSDYRTSKRVCSVEGCGTPVHLRGYCVKHYARMRRTGTTDDPKPRGDKKKHPFWMRWTQLKRRGALVPEWETDFWAFVDGVSPQPEDTKKLTRIREDAPYGPTNFRWMKTPTHEETLAYYRDWNRRNPDARRAVRFRDHYGITVDQYRQMYEDQGGCCAICGAKGAPLESVSEEWAQDGAEVLHVDHDHQLHEVRDLLCKHCNRGLGCFEDNPALIFEAGGYLLRHRPMPKLFQYPTKRLGKDVKFWGLKREMVKAFMSIEDRLKIARKRRKEAS